MAELPPVPVPQVPQHDVPLSRIVRDRSEPAAPAREPDRQVEIQLGHLCNNRCLFCVSGQRTARGQAGLTELSPVLARLREARAAGHEKITLLGGEPTLQPIFLPVVKACAELGFSEVVIFTNGAKTASGTLIDQALATGAPLSFRISIQGASEASHERTTLKDGSFARIVRTLEHLHRRGVPISVNMCLVASNCDDVPRFAELLAPYGVRQLHVDLMRPLDAGERSDEELTATLAPLHAIGAPLTAMVRAFPPGFDVNVGNLPFCLAPSIADVIHHDGQSTETISIDGGHDVNRPTVSAPWNKYETKRRDKVKVPRCAECVFDGHCSGIYADYLRLQGDAAVAPVSSAALRALDPQRRWGALHLGPIRRDLTTRAAALGAEVSIEHEGLEALVVTIAIEGARAAARLTAEAERGEARYEGMAVQLLERDPRAVAVLAELLRDQRPVVPLLEGASPRPALRGALRALSAAAPLGPLRWMRTVATEPDAIVLTLEAEGAAVRVELTVGSEGKVHLRYRATDGPTPSQLAALKTGMARLLDVLSGARSASRADPEARG